jgi:hypothetical protein
MKKIVYILVLFAVGSCQAATWNYTYGIFDGSNPFDQNNNWAPIDYPRIGELPSPGYLAEGGEGFDLEGLRIKEDDNYVYVALANSFGYAASSVEFDDPYELGDLFVGVNGGQYDYAIDIQSIGYNLADNQTASGHFDFYEVNGNYQGITDIPGSYYGTWVEDAVGAWQLDGAQLQRGGAGAVEYALTYDDDFEDGPIKPYMRDTYVWEFRFAKALLGDFHTLDFHVTLACGNDLMETTHEAVPEPTTVMLFGLGLLGTGLVRRMRK